MSGFDFKMPAADCIALPNTSKLDAVFEIDKEIVVQDYNSQKVLDVLKKEDLFNEPVISVWDCCAASGGKSILAYDILEGNIQLTVSDIRESILSNLKKRFAAAGIKHYQSFVSDLSSADSKLPTGQAGCQLIICDAPCTGSGTWSRTPEQLFFFKEKMIAAYAVKQQQIVSNIIPQLKEGGIFIYITCSVFKKENEEMVNFIKEKFHLKLLQMELLKGFDKKADSMFVAVFIKK
jgi:16S rRNA (cytosine967-C5)-methyltransferase